MGSLVAAIVRWAHRRRLVVAAVVLGAVLISLEGARRLSFDADVLSLLPRDSRVIQSFRARFSHQAGYCRQRRRRRKRLRRSAGRT